MKFLGSARDTFFYFFAIYSVLFLLFDVIGYLGFLQVLTYLGLLLFFSLRLHQYFIYIVDHKPKLKKIKISKAQKELFENVTEAQKNFKQGTIILFFIISFFVLSFLYSHYGTSQEYPESQKIQPKPPIVTNISELTNKQVPILEKSTKTEALQTGAIISEKATLVKKLIEEPIITENIGKDIHQNSLVLEKNVEARIKDIYALTPFTKYGSDFFNILQLQRVLTKLGYYSGIPDGSFNFETKLAIYNTLVHRCGWPKDSTKGVFGPKAKECIDNLTITIEDGESHGAIQ